jgi:hypothetical protein
MLYTGIDYHKQYSQVHVVDESRWNPKQRAAGEIGMKSLTQFHSGSG